MMMFIQRICIAFNGFGNRMIMEIATRLSAAIDLKKVKENNFYTNESSDETINS